MGEHDRARIGLTQFADVAGRELFVHLAAAAPGDHLDLRLSRDIPGEVFVGGRDPRTRGRPSKLDDLPGIG